MNFTINRSLYSFCFLLLFANGTYAQYTNSWNNITTKHQLCLDKGQDLLGCSIRYYSQADSLLRFACKRIFNQLKEPKRKEFKKEQGEWSKKRDSFFEVQASKNWELFGKESRDAAMVTYTELANFIIHRIRILEERFRV